MITYSFDFSRLAATVELGINTLVASILVVLEFLRPTMFASLRLGLAYRYGMKKYVAIALYEQVCGAW